MEHEEEILSILKTTLHELKELGVKVENIICALDSIENNTEEISELAADWKKIKDSL